jgi:prolyl-tRNA editing enzyme YbaK/EbsC (Cys-tRNA(Pro) deacylase)
MLIDQDLLQYQTIWAAAGTPRSVFSLSPDDLQDLTAGDVENIS